MSVPQFQPSLCEPASRSAAGTRGVGYKGGMVAMWPRRSAAAARAVFNRGALPYSPMQAQTRHPAQKNGKVAMLDGRFQMRGGRRNSQV